jgi:hypothetical protein
MSFLKGECILPKYVLVGQQKGRFISEVFAGNDNIAALREEKRRSGWQNEPNVKIYQLKE